MKPLSGCRVLDLGIITAGAATAAVLADFGAEVIKVESPSYRDPFRRWLSNRPDDAVEDLPPFFRATNRGKAGLSVDLKHPRGREVFLRLVARSDIVVENFRRGVLAKLQLDYATLRATNPNLILASISSQGESGPEARYVSYGSTLEAVGGLAWTTGYAGGAPTVSGVDLNYPDQVVALFASAMIVTAWRARQQGKGGAHLDLSQRELTGYLSGEAFVAAGAGLDVRPSGNAQAPHFLQDCFRTADGKWLAMTVEPAQRATLAALLGIDTIGEWVALRPLEEAQRVLNANGIAAAAALNGRQVLEREGQVWKDALQRLPDGTLVKGFAMQFEREPMTVARDAPVVGADTVEVLQRVAGLSTREIDDLAAEGVIEIAARKRC